MDNALVHPFTEQSMRRAADADQHAFAFVGPRGAGKSHLADIFATMLLGASVRPNQLLRISPTNQHIGIDEIREVQRYLKLRTTGRAKTRRIVIIEDAQAMSGEAQNALLKTLEEPPHDTKIILTIDGMSALKQTVYSRLQIIQVKPCTLSDAVSYFETGHRSYDKEALQKAYIISGGLAGLCIALARDDQHPLIDAIKQAKGYLSSSAYDRLIKVNELAKDKEALALFLFAVQRILSTAVRTSKANISKQSQGMKAVYDAQNELAVNSNTKLFLVNLSLQL